MPCIYQIGTEHTIQAIFPCQALTREVADLKLRLGEGEERERVLRVEVRKGEEKAREREEREQEVLLLLREIKGEVSDEVR